jgi:predicted metal-dependent hydrolase
VQVRRPEFDFSDVDAIWADDVEACIRRNAQGIVPAYIEPFLIQVMRRAAAELDPERDEQLLKDIDVFNRQEAQHFKWHRAMNKRVSAEYPGMLEHERAYEADYERMLAEDPLDTLLAYCEGFEAMGLAAATGVLDGAMESELGRAHPAPVLLWRWHLAEEYEHRTVAYDVLRRLYGESRLGFYRLRISGLVRAMRHIRGAVESLQDHLIEAYEETHGVPVERAAGKPPSVKLQVKAISKVLLPTYDPARAKAPRTTEQALAAV